MEGLESRCLLSAYSFIAGNVECQASSDAWTFAVGPNADNTGSMGSAADSQATYQGSTGTGSASGNVTITSNKMEIQANAAATSSIVGPYPFGDTYVTGSGRTLINDTIGFTLTSAASVTVSGSFTGNLGSSFDSVATLDVGGFVINGTAGTVNTTLPLAAGTYHVYAEAYVNSILEWGNGSNLSLAAGLDITITIGQKPADLTGQFTGTLPVALAGKTVSPHLQLENGFFATSVGDAVGNESTDYYLAKTPALDGTAVLIGNSSEAINVTAGGTTTEAPVLTIPADTAGGNYFLIANINAGHGIGESNYSNNIASTPLAVAASPTTVTLGNLCNNVYTGTTGAGGYQAVVPYQTDPKNKGFGAEAYATADGHSVVIAFRGTVTAPNSLATLKDLLADLSFGEATPNALLTSQVADGVAFLKAIRAKYPQAAITLTGHSLGGAVAQLVGEAAGLETITFNAPGGGQFFTPGDAGSPLYGVLQPIFGSGGGSITNYRLYGEQVSLVGQPIGTQVTLADPAGTPASIGTNTSDAALNLVGNLSAYLHLHQLGSVGGPVPGILTQIAVSPLPVTSSQGEPNDSGAAAGMLQAISTAATLGGTLLNFQFPGVVAGIENLLDPGNGTNFVLAGQAGSPELASIALPELSGVAAYQVRFEAGATWSAFQTVQAGVHYVLGAPAQAVEFDPVDGLGQSVLVTDAFLIEATFAAAGTFTGSLAEINSAAIDTPAKLAFIQQPTTIRAGQAMAPSVVVAVEDAAGLMDPINNSTITLTLSSTASGATLGGTVSVPVVNGLATFTGLTLTQAGQYALVATDGALTPATSKPFGVNPETASHLVLVQAGAGLVGKPLMPAITAAVEDQFGNLLTADHSSVTLQIVSGPGNLSGTTSVSTSKGRATFNKVALSQAGTYTLSAVDNSLAIATPLPFAQVVDQGVTSLATPRPATYTFGQTISLPVLFKSSAPATVPFTGSASLIDSDNNLLGNATLSANGAAKFVLAGVAPGAYVSTITYSGDANHTAFTSGAFTVLVNPAATSTTLATSTSTPVFGQGLILTATVNSSKAPGVGRTGRVSFFDGAGLLQTVALNGSSTASLTLTPASPGAHLYKAVYSGDGNFKASTSAGVSRSVNKDKTSIVLTPLPAGPVVVNQTFNLQVQVSVLAPGASTLTGVLVTIKDNGKVLGIVPLDSSGAASLAALSYSAAGTHNFTAIYAGDATTLAVTSGALKVTIMA